MTSQRPITTILEYETSELKLAALLFSEIPQCSFDVFAQGNSIRKTIRIKYPAGCKAQVSKIEKDFINKIASANVYLYNKALNMIRDRLRGQEHDRGEAST